MAALCVASCGGDAGRKIMLADFLAADAGSATDAMPALRAAIEACGRGDATLVLPGGELNIRPDMAYEKYQYISNNDGSMKRIAFMLKDVRNLTIEGNGTLLRFAGYISPFDLESCDNVRIENLSIDYVRPFVSEGTVTAVGDGWYDMTFAAHYNPVVYGGNLHFRDGDGNEYPFNNLLEFDTRRREVAYHVHDRWMSGGTCEAERLPDGTFRLHDKAFDTATVGNTIIFGAQSRLHPAFTLWECDGFTLADVDIYCCCGMGVIAQCSRDIELDRVKVVPAPGSDRMISISADATHFINCKGYIRMIDCDFLNQKDDATNIHGWYMAVEKRLGDNRLLLGWRHSQQRGIDFIRPGMTLELVDNQTLESYARLKVAHARMLNADYAEVTFAEPLPERVAAGHVAAEDDGYPDVLISGCRIGNNRARGLLLGSRGRIVVEKCTFHTPGSAILFEGDGNYWFEQSGVRDVVIRDNVFDNCMYGSSTWGRACIAVGTGIPKGADSRYHRNITVENNTFRGFDSRIVNVYCTDGFTFRNNRIETTGDYPASGDPAQAFVQNYCDNVTFE